VVLCMALSAILALGWMSLAGWRWDFFNAAAILLCLGGGIDYSIHMLLALRRGDTRRRKSWRTPAEACLSALSPP